MCNDQGITSYPVTSEDRATFIFSSNMTFSVVERGGNSLDGTFVVESVPFYKIGSYDRFRMRESDERADAYWYRVTLNPFSDSEGELFVSYRDAYDIVFYQPSYRTTIVVRQISPIVQGDMATAELIAGTYFERERYLVLDDAGITFSALDTDQRMTYVFNEDMTFRIQCARNRSVVFYEGDFDIERIATHRDIDASEWFLERHIDDFANVESFHLVARNFTGINSAPEFDLYISRVNDDEIFIYKSTYAGVVAVRVNQVQ